MFHFMLESFSIVCRVFESVVSYATVQLAFSAFLRSCTRCMRYVRNTQVRPPTRRSGLKVFMTDGWCIQKYACIDGRNCRSNFERIELNRSAIRSLISCGYSCCCGAEEAGERLAGVARLTSCSGRTCSWMRSTTNSCSNAPQSSVQPAFCRRRTVGYQCACALWSFGLRAWMTR